ncbi:MAG: hypothetical protein LBU76_10860 [Azoarcus sp.]|nr:hypothetical protein [Azoarcus sp.]
MQKQLKNPAAQAFQAGARQARRDGERRGRGCNPGVSALAKAANFQPVFSSFSKISVSSLTGCGNEHPRGLPPRIAGLLQEWPESSAKFGRPTTMGCAASRKNIAG